MDSDAFTATPQSRKGKLGEEIVLEFFASIGGISYSPETDGAHPLDKIMLTDEGPMLMEVKCKARRTRWNDTGIDVSHYETYKAAEKRLRMRMFIAFVDEYLGKVYGNFLDILDKDLDIPLRQKKQVAMDFMKEPVRSYPRNELGDTGLIRYFSLEAIIVLCPVTEKLTRILKGISGPLRNHPYPKKAG